MGGQWNLAGRQLGRYEVLTQLASGGMAAVYIARAQGVAGFERLVAVKVLHPHIAHEEEFITMFLDEARLAARIRHPNVVATLDISDTHGDGFFLVMDYVEGDHLGALLGRLAKQGNRLPPNIVARIIIDILEGLSAAHNLIDEDGKPLLIVHRDISPHNILIGTDGVARLTDFGVAKAEVRMSSTREGQFKGKLAYMAPEQASSGHADHRSDLFSMGIVLWEALTGRRLFRGETNAATLSKILQDPIPMPSERIAELEPFDALLARALARDPNSRFQSANEMIEAIEQISNSLYGIATTRAVSAIAKESFAEKVEQEQQRIKSTIARLGRAEIGETQLPIPRDGSLSTSHSQMVAKFPAQARFSHHAQELSDPVTIPVRGRSYLGLILFSLLLFTGGAIGLFVWKSGQQPQRQDLPSKPTQTVERPSQVNTTPPLGMDPSSQVPPLTSPRTDQLAAPSNTQADVSHGIDTGNTNNDRRTSTMRGRPNQTTSEQGRTNMSASTMQAPPSRDPDSIIQNPYRN